MDRRAFTGMFVFLSAVVALLALIASYMMWPTREWLLAFDPLGIKFSFTVLTFEPKSSVAFSVGFAIEVIRLAVIALIAVFLIGYAINASQIIQERSSLKAAGYLKQSSKAVYKLDSESRLQNYVEFLWSRYWWLWTPIVVVFVLISSFPLGADSLERFRTEHPDILNGRVYSDTVSRQADFLPTMKVIPRDIGEQIPLASQEGAWEGDTLFAAAVKSGRWTRAILDGEECRTALKDGALDPACIRTGGGPYIPYVLYSLVIYGMLVLPIIAHFWRLLGAMQRDIASATNKLCEEIQSSTAKDALHLQRTHGLEFRTLTINFFDPIGWLVLLLFIYGAYEIWFGRFTITFMGYVFFGIAYVIAFGVMMIGFIVMNDLNRYSRCLLAKAGHQDTSPERSEELAKEAKLMSPEQIMASRGVLLPWRLFAILAGLFKRGIKMPGLAR